MSPVANAEQKITEFKRRLRMWVQEAREYLAEGDRWQATFCLNAAGECRAKIIEIKARAL